MELLGRKQEAVRVLFLMGAQICLSALGRTQTVPLPEPPQVQSEESRCIAHAACSE